MTTMSNHKKLAAMVGIVAVAGILAGCSANSSAPTHSSSPKAGAAGPTVPTGSVSLTFVGYGGTGQQGEIDAWQTPFTAAHPNVTFLNTSPAAVATVQSQVETGNIQWDVVNVAPYAAEQNCGTLFDKLSTPELNPKDFPAGTFGPCYVGNFVNGPILGYNTDDFPNPKTAPKTIQDYFNTKKFPGKRGVVSNLQSGMLEYPLLADGVKGKDLYPININKALDKWDTIKSETIFAANDGVLQQAVASNQVSMFLLDESRFLPLLQSGAHIKPLWGTTVAAPNAFAVPKGDKNLAAAEAFIEAADQPGPAAKIAELDGVAPVNLKSKPSLSKYAQEVNMFGKADTGTVITQDIQWYAKNNNTDQTILNNWLAG